MITRRSGQLPLFTERTLRDNKTEPCFDKTKEFKEGRSKDLHAFDLYEITGFNYSWYMRKEDEKR